MGKFNFNKYSKGVIIIEIQSLMPERFINLLWKNKIYVKNIKKLNITTMIMEINLSDYNKIEDIVKRTNTKVKIIKRRGIAFYMIKLRRRSTLAVGSIIFVAIIFYLSTFIWSIDIDSEHNLSPYEIRQQLFAWGIKPGTSKKSINVYEIEDKLIKSNDSIMWVRARIEGSSLKISAEERQSPPDIIPQDSPCNLVALKDGEVVRVYTSAGTAVVKKNDIVKKGQLLVKGEQGKEGLTYQVHAAGDVICKTFYEENKTVKISGTKKERTGNFVENNYINVAGRKIYLKKSLNKYKSYDKIEDNMGFIHKEFFYETKDVPFNLDSKKVIDDTVNELYIKITCNMDKSVNIIDKVINTEQDGDSIKVRLLVVAEENIAVPEKIQ